MTSTAHVLKNILVLLTLADSAAWKLEIAKYLPCIKEENYDCVFIMDEEVDGSITGTSVASEPVSGAENLNMQLLLQQFIVHRELLADYCEALSFHLWESLCQYFDTKPTKLKEEVFPSEEESVLIKQSAQELQYLYNKTLKSRKHHIVRDCQNVPSIIRRVLEQYILMELWVDVISSTLVDLYETSWYEGKLGQKRGAQIFLSEEKVGIIFHELTNIVKSVLAFVK